MENEQPELIARTKKSKTPLIIGIVVAIHIVLIGSAFIIQEIHKRNAPALAKTDAAPDMVEATPPAIAGETSALQPDPVTMAPEARAPKHTETAALAAPEKRGDLMVPAPVPIEKKPVAKVEPPAAKAKVPAKTSTTAATYTVKKGDTWKAVSTRLKVPVLQLAKDNKLDSTKYLKIGQKLAYKQTIPVKTTDVAAAAPKPATVAAKTQPPAQTPATTPASDKPAAVASASATTAAAPVPAPATVAPVAAPGPFVLYEVKKGDTLGSIATRHAMRVAELRSANELKDDRIMVGQKLKVQQPGPKPAVQSLVADVEPRASAPQIHVVSKGETVSELAHRYGVTTAELLKANNINDPSKVLVGQRLKIPSLEFPGSRADLRDASPDQETLSPTLENTTKI